MTKTMQRHRGLRAPVGLALLLAASLALAAPVGASASTWVETGDAGSFLSGAQEPTGSGELTAITGAISSAEPNSDEDLYRVCLTGESFSATTSTGSDPMLYLFDADGRRVAFNDDHLTTTESRLVLSAPAAGAYYLAIVAFRNLALDAGGGDVRFGDDPLDHWNEQGTSTFDYSIALSGVEFCSAGDIAAPTVTITSPADGATYVLGQSVAADYACADEAGGSGLASCVGTVADGAPLDTSSVGAKSFTVTARDNAGNQAEVVHRYTVAYPFAGFFAPVDNDALNVVKAGQAVPVKFSLGADRGLNILSGSPSSQPVQCDGSLPAEPVEQTVTAGASSLSYDPATGTYTYTWKTDKAWAGTCRQLTVTLIDGTTHSALFSFTR